MHRVRLGGPALVCAWLACLRVASAQQPSVDPDPTYDTRRDNAHTDRIILVSTAETHPRGTLYLSNYQLLIARVGCAFTDWLQTELKLLPGIADAPAPLRGGMWALDGSAKANIIRMDAFRLAASGGVGLVVWGRGHESFETRFDIASQVCLPDGAARCRHSFSLNVGGVFMPATTVPLVFAVGVGGTLAITNAVHLLLEVSYPFAPEIRTYIEGDRPHVSGFKQALLPAMGLRYAQPSWAFDLFWIASIGDFGVGPFGPIAWEAVDNDIGVIGVAFTYRDVPEPR